MKPDVNYRSFVEERQRMIGPQDWVPPETPLDYDDVFKCSNCENFMADGLWIPGGEEDCVDAVRGSGYRFRNLRLHPNGVNGVTIKGAIDGWSLSNVIFETHGKKSDIECGQFSIHWRPGDPPTRGGVIQMVSATDDAPIKVVLWNSTEPVVLFSKVKFVKVPRCIWYPYFLFRYAQTRLSRA